MTAQVKHESLPIGATRSGRYRWICRDHDRLRVGRWGMQWDAKKGAQDHNRKEHSDQA